MDTIHRLLHNNIKERGLYYGKAGEVLLLYSLFQMTGDTGFQKKAINNLNEISEHIAGVEDLGFAEGLAGIGWAIEWVAQNNFLEIDTNEVLEDIDNILYKSVIFSSDNNISLHNGTLGKFLYFLSRYKSKNPGNIRLKNIFQEECLILLTDDLYEKICGENGLLHKENLSGEDLVSLGHAIYFLSDFLWLKLNEPTVETLLYNCIIFINKFFENVEILSLEKRYIPYYKFLTACYYLASENHKNSYWRDRAEFFYKMLNCEDSEYDSENLNSLYNLFYLLIFKKKHSRHSEIDLDQLEICLSNKNGKLLLFEIMKQGCVNNNPKQPIELMLMLESKNLMPISTA